MYFNDYLCIENVCLLHTGDMKLIHGLQNTMEMLCLIQCYVCIKVEQV